MDLKAFLSPLSADAREEFAAKCGTSRGHLQNVMYGIRPCAPELAVLIEKHSACAVTRKDLRDDWQAIWPELADAPRSAANHPGQRSGDKPVASAGTGRKTARA